MKEACNPNSLVCWRLTIPAIVDHRSSLHPVVSMKRGISGLRFLSVFLRDILLGSQRLCGAPTPALHKLVASLMRTHPCICKYPVSRTEATGRELWQSIPGRWPVEKTMLLLVAIPIDLVVAVMVMSDVTVEVSRAAQRNCSGPSVVEQEACNPRQTLNNA